MSTGRRLVLDRPLELTDLLENGRASIEEGEGIGMLPLEDADSCRCVRTPFVASSLTCNEECALCRDPRLLVEATHPYYKGTD
jgi:hypothetical protein